MHKIGIYINAPLRLLIIETPAALQFELCDSNGNLLVTGNKLQQPNISVDISRLAKGSYVVKLHVDGEQLYKTIEL